MKRILVSVNLLLLIVIIIGACNKFNRIQVDTVTHVVDDSTCFPIDYDAMTDEGLLTPATARMMSLDYAKDFGKKFIQNGEVLSGVQDARAAWFNLKVFKKFIHDVEDTICQKGCRNLELGIRIYYAKYPDSSNREGKSDLATVPRKYLLHHTLFMVPTYYDRATDRYIDFDPSQLQPGVCQPLPFNYADNTNKALIMMIPLGSALTLDGIQNHGGLAPPPDNGGTFGDPE